MTAAKSTARRRRQSASRVPRELAEWFGGKVFARRPLFFSLPRNWQVAEQWAHWIVDSPGTAPPAGWEWLADPNDSRHQIPPFMRAAIARGEA